MTETELKNLLKTVAPPDEAARAAAHAHWAALAKPLGGLGQLETMVEAAAALTGDPAPDFTRRAVLVLCADNGVVAQGVSQTDASVTRAVLENLTARRTSVCCMAAAAHSEVVPVDMGIAGVPVPGAVDRRVAPGTRDFTQGPAMTREQAVQAVAAGIELVRTQKQNGVRLLATGEMGIGNTTTSSAVAAVLLGRPAAEMTGRGAGLSDEGLHRKIHAIERGIAVNHPNAADPLGVLAALGGFDIAGLCGVFLGGALEKIPVIMDGFISGVAALCAVRLCPAAAKAVFASHASSEPAARLVLDAAESGIPLRTLLVSDDGARYPEAEKLAGMARRCFSIPNELAAYISETEHPQGIFAVGEMPNPLPVVVSVHGPVAVTVNAAADPAVLRSTASSCELAISAGSRSFSQPAKTASASSRAKSLQKRFIVYSFQPPAFRTGQPFREKVPRPLGQGTSARPAWTITSSASRRRRCCPFWAPPCRWPPSATACTCCGPARSCTAP